MITNGHMVGSGKIGHNTSFFIIPAGSDIALKLGWGDFSIAALQDNLFEPQYRTRDALVAAGCLPLVGGHYIEIPADMFPVYILTEHDSYWDAKRNQALVGKPETAPATDPKSGSAFRHLLPPDAPLLSAEYVRLLARWTWDGSQLTTVPQADHYKAKDLWYQSHNTQEVPNVPTQP